jgi:hypothetical protein
LRFSLAARACPTLQVYPKNATIDHLKIDMPSADIYMVENDISSQVTTDYSKRLI